MLKVLMMSVIALAFVAKKAHATLLHFKCTGITKDGELCSKNLQVSDSNGYTTTCTKCNAKYTFKDGYVFDKGGNVVDTWK